MREPILSSIKRPRPSLDGGYICDYCERVVKMIAYDGQRFVCLECKANRENETQQEATEDK